ncbi:hypothetical protein MOTC310_27160 [Methylobacterium oryzae]|uniref:Uncharacterized protein n=1 Tax=Methylobacterium oryzae TaxID=334852 RepID=A0ABU7TVD6_9HYPH
MQYLKIVSAHVGDSLVEVWLTLVGRHETELSLNDSGPADVLLSVAQDQAIYALEIALEIIET